MRGAVRGGLLVAVLIAAGTVGTPIVERLRAPTPRPPVEETGPAPRLGLPFIENGGQLDDRVAYHLREGETSAFFTSSGMRLRLGTGAETWSIEQELLGARSVQPLGVERAPTTVSYFHGGPAEWQAGLETFQRVVYREPWPGIDVEYTRTNGRLKYRFVLRPGADPTMIAMRWAGATGVRLDEAGRLQIRAGETILTDEAPTSFQPRNGRRKPVSTSYSLLDDGTVGFDLAQYDRSRRLVVDPALILYAGFIGGPSSDDANGIAVDAAGSAYVVGDTNSDTGFPATVGPDTSYNGDGDAYIAKVNPAGTAFEYVGFIGGDDEDAAAAVGVDDAGSAYVVGQTRGGTFPATVGPDTSHNGNFDAFIAKVNSTGTGLDYAGFLGGGNFDYGRGVAIDPTGAAYVGGRADPGFPAVVGPDSTVGGSNDVFVAKVAPGGGSIVYSGFVGGDGFEDGGDVAVDELGRAYVTGYADSPTGFPASTGPDLTFGGMEDGFIARVNAEGTGFEYAGFIGGSDPDFGSAVAVDSAGRAYVTGSTRSDADFPVVGGPDSSYNGGFNDAFVVQVTPSGDGFLASGYLGGTGGEGGSGIALDPAGTIHVGGSGNSPTFTRSSRGRRGFSSDQRVFVARLQPGGTGLADVTFISGGNGEIGGAIAVDEAGNPYVAGTSASTQGLNVATGPDPSYNGGFSDGFVAKLQTAETCRGKPVTILGTPERDSIEGTKQADVMDALGGNDIVSSLGGNDLVCAGSGNDRVDTGKGTDTALGENGKDKLNGGAGKKDRMIGGKGKDKLRGGAGAKDVCKGGPGKDKELGGECEKGKI